MDQYPSLDFGSNHQCDMEKRTFKRDKRSPLPFNSKTSELMSAIKSKNTKPEFHVRRSLWSAGLKGYRLHSPIPGRPDICFHNHKIAIFIHGCYWHRCPTCDLPLPKNNTAFWEDKFKKNQARDIRKKELLETAGWRVMTLWECELEENLPNLIDQVATLTNKSKDILKKTKLPIK